MFNSRRKFHLAFILLIVAVLNMCRADFAPTTNILDIRFTEIISETPERRKEKLD